MGSLVLTLLVLALAIILLSLGPFDENRKMCLELLLLLKLDLKAEQTCAVDAVKQKNIAEIVQLKLGMILLQLQV